MSRSALFLLLSLSACAGAEGPWPSLALRPGEQPRVIAAVNDVLQPQSPSLGVPVAVEARLTRQAQAAEGELLTARSALDQALGGAAKAPLGSEAWVAAQTALSRFEIAAASILEVRTAIEQALEGRSSPALSSLRARLAKSESDNVIVAQNASAALVR